MPVKTFDVFEGLPPLKLANNRQSVSELHAHLRRLIMDGELPPGTELNQADLGRRYNVSRGPMREALRLLQQEGLVDMQLNQRATVRQLNGNEVDQLYGTRVALESLGVRITAGHLRPEEYDSARALLGKMELALEQHDMQLWISEHREFHQLCSARAEGPLAEIILSYSERSERYLRYAQNTHPRTFAAARAEHERILRLIKAGDADGASALMASHLAKTAMLVLEGLGVETKDGVVQQALTMAGGKKLR
jgi:DNA-binding GntR family transcriptional regulator